MVMAEVVEHLLCKRPESKSQSHKKRKQCIFLKVIKTKINKVLGLKMLILAMFVATEKEMK
jgi:hypothetical protein